MVLKKEEKPFVAYGNNELDEKETAGKDAVCPNCKKKHTITFGTDAETGKTSKMLGFVKCGEESYLVSINGKLLWNICMEYNQQGEYT